VLCRCQEGVRPAAAREICDVACARTNFLTQIAPIPDLVRMVLDAETLFVEVKGMQIAM
jgi:hypothetical protein